MDGLKRGDPDVGVHECNKLHCPLTDSLLDPTSHHPCPASPTLASKPSERAIVCTAKGCGGFAKRILQTEDIRTVENQGATSYTLVCRSQRKNSTISTQAIRRRRLGPCPSNLWRLSTHHHLPRWLSTSCLRQPIDSGPHAYFPKIPLERFSLGEIALNHHRTRRVCGQVGLLVTTDIIILEQNCPGDPGAVKAE